MAAERVRCYCISLFKDHFMGDKGCQLNKNGVERTLCPTCENRFDTLTQWIHHKCAQDWAKKSVTGA